MTVVLASVLVFVFTTVLTIAGVGAAFIIIPTFYWLGIPLTEAMAVALLLNAISMSFASINYIRYRLVAFRTAVPIIILAVFFSPLGAYSAHYFSKELLIAFFLRLPVLCRFHDAFLYAENEKGGRCFLQRTENGYRLGHRGGISRRLIGGRRRKFHRPGLGLARL